MESYDIVLYNSTKLFGQTNQEHLGLGYLASSLRQSGFKVKIIDSLLERLTPKEGIELLQQIDFQILGISFLSYAWKETKELVQEIKEKRPDVKIILGGHFVSFAYQKILDNLPEVDYILLGECEKTLPQLVSRLINSKTVFDTPGLVSPDRKNLEIEPLDDLDILPFPARDYLPRVLKKRKFATLNTSRGCYGICTFCSVHNFYKRYAKKKWRSRSAENVLEEIQWLSKEFQVTNFDFQDDNFMGPGRKGKERAVKLGKLIKKQGIEANFRFDLRINDIDRQVLKLWKDIGLQEVLVGVESINQADLDFYKKNITPEKIKEGLQILDDLGIKYILGNIYFHPYTSIESVYKNLKYIDKINYLEYYPLTVLNVYEGTEVKDILDKRGHLKGEFYNYKWNFVSAVTEKYFELSYKVMKKIRFLENLCIQQGQYRMVARLREHGQKFLLNLAEAFINEQDYEKIFLSINRILEDEYRKLKMEELR